MKDVESHEDHYDPDVGDEFTADYIPAGWEDSPEVPFKVRVRAGEFSDDFCGMSWTIIGPPEFVDDPNNEFIIEGYGFDEFDNLTDYVQPPL